jgi:hypothetical protein
LIAPAPPRRPTSAATTLTLTPSAAAAPPAGAGWSIRRGGRRDVAHLHEHAGIERHHVDIAAAGEPDALAIGQEMRIGFDCR